LEKCIKIADTPGNEGEDAVLACKGKFEKAIRKGINEDGVKEESDEESEEESEEESDEESEE